MFLYFYKKHYKNIIKNIKLQMFPIATFYFSHFLFYVTVIMVHTQLWTKQLNVRTNTKYTSQVNSF